jgi:hypothetical protein
MQEKVTSMNLLWLMGLSRWIRESGFLMGTVGSTTTSYSVHYSKIFDEKTDIILRVNYHKDGSVTSGSDIGWIENIILN